LRLRTDVCISCSTRKLLQARGLCFACYKREWRARRGEHVGGGSSRGDHMLHTA
jgi:hypothetical protein